MSEWVQHNLWSLWLIAGLALSAAELLTGDFTLLMLGVGALAGCLTAVVAPGLWWLQIAVAAVVATAMLGFVRPELLRRFRAVGQGYRSAFDQLVGSQGLVTEAIGPAVGAVLVNGNTWTARPEADGLLIPAGDTIEVVALDGVTAIVRPVEGAFDGYGH